MRRDKEVSRMKPIVAAGAFLLVLGSLATEARACWDNTDQVIAKLKRLELSTDQLKDVFAFQKEHREVVERAHLEGLGCRYHENHHVVFEKKAIGVLDDGQFKRHTGRDRTEVESLEHENYLLKKRIAELEKRLKELEARLAK
jgi:hypothetical protein